MWQAVLEGHDTHQVKNYSGRTWDLSAPCAGDDNLLLYDRTVHSHKALAGTQSGWYPVYEQALNFCCSFIV